jgi:hypothetical protein
MVEKEPLWPKVMGYILWTVSALIGLGSLFAAIDLVDKLAVKLVVCDPLHMVECSGQMRVLMLIAYAVLGIIWLVWYIIIAETYTRAKTAELVAKRFATTTGIQAAIVAVWLIVTRIIFA